MDISFNTLVFELGDILFTSCATPDNTSISQATIQKALKTQTWSEYEKGALSEDDCYSRVALELGVQVDEFSGSYRAFRNSMTIRSSTVDLIKELKPGRKVCAMLNISIPDWEHLRPTISRLGLFDIILTSSQYGVRKPSLAFYRHLFHGIRDSPKETLFIDNQLENRIVARSLGSTAILFDDVPSLKRAVLNICLDPITRGNRFLHANAKAHISFTTTGVLIQENFSQFLILEATRDQTLVAYTKFDGPFNFFRGRGELTTHDFPCDADTTSIGLSVCDSISLETRNRIMDDILNLRDTDNIVQVYFDMSRPRIDPVVCVNVLTLFYLHGRGAELKETLDWVEAVLIHRAYTSGTRYYEPPEAFLLYVYSGCIIIVASH